MKQNKERAISIISGEYYEDVLSTLPVTIANNSHVKGNIKAPKVTAFGDVEVIAENGCDLGNVQSFGTVTLATRTLVNACCGSDLVDCFENVNAEYLMSEGQIRTGEECHIKEMQLKKFN